MLLLLQVAKERKRKKEIKLVSREGKRRGDMHIVHYTNHVLISNNHPRADAE
jgi:hypothetical protein